MLKSNLSVKTTYNFNFKMFHILQPKHTRLSEKDTEKLLNDLNISKAQLPKILSDDMALPKDCAVGDVVKIERKDKDTGKTSEYYRVVV